ncbi:MAG: pantoate--beta-alanine ligase [Xanthomonadaceae bacterium]|nr:pantoate--beta-alanine ligase [Xanthomonadaceae bacterium]MDP2184233.1 pantoate--beta-alanine ligase [Xanthomonadales bacterium]MDZ4114779.1 pantoate--beta-alanine ligase [Xanthomonadaceae bacterium]MDZ4377434.1 pantoate--beta-alanine ligase [Xanthomonadaceae bacterium]
MNTFDTVADLRAQVKQWRSDGLRVGFVPTMGNLHDGHFALVDLARQHADRVVASIFVNPTQFGPNEDYALYPRTPDGDITGLAGHGCDALLLPSVAEMYPFGTAGCVQMHVPGITDILCGRHRPGHFNGVATVVARLFNMVQPDVAVFGRKDYQQLQVVRYMASEMAFAVEVIPAPTLREPSGLAMSSRNRYLDASERTTADTIYRALQAMRDARRQGDPPGRIEGVGERMLLDAGFVVDYVEVLRADLSRPREGSEPGLIGFIAARLGRTRLIDNLDLQ